MRAVASGSDSFRKHHALMATWTRCETSSGGSSQAAKRATSASISASFVYGTGSCLFICPPHQHRHKRKRLRPSSAGHILSKKKSAGAAGTGGSFRLLIEEEYTPARSIHATAEIYRHRRSAS